MSQAPLRVDSSRPRCEFALTAARHLAILIPREEFDPAMQIPADEHIAGELVILTDA